MKQLTNLTKGQTYYFRVTAVNNNGVEGAYSNEASVVAINIKPGQNMLSNGDFAGGKTSWSFPTPVSPAAATWSVTSGVSTCTISNGGSSASSIQLKQTGIPLVLGNKYVLEFDAWSTSGTPTRYIEAKLQNSSGSLNYGGTGSTSITSTLKHIRTVLTMAGATDLSSMLVFNLGASIKPVYIDNVSLFTPPPGDLNQDGKVDLLDLRVMTTDWRKSQTGLPADLNADGQVDFRDLGILGDNWSGSP